jgi:small subunit ribosomal protein S1
VFVGIEEGIDGLIHVSDISWTQRINSPAEVYKKSDIVEAVVLHVDRENERFSLGVKQLSEDPWLTIGKRFPVGAVVKGKVTNVTDFGLFLEIDSGIEGLVRTNEITRDKADEAPQKKFNVGDETKAVVLNIDPHERKISLSIKSAIDREEGENIREFATEKGPARSSLGEKLKERLGDKG